MQTIAQANPLFAIDNGVAADENALLHALQQDIAHVELPAYGVTICDDDGCNLLKNHIMRHGKIKTIDINGSKISHYGWECLLEAFDGPFIRELECLDVGNSQLSSEACAILLRRLIHFAPKLESLNISENKLGDEVEEELVEWMPAKLKCLNLSHNFFGKKCVYKVLKNVLNNVTSTIEVLSLSKIRLDFACAELLGKIIGMSSNLRELYLYHCYIDDASADALAAGIHGSHLEVLDLSNNRVVGAFSYENPNGVGILSFPPTLRVLYIDHNYIHSSQIQGFVKSLLPVKSTLQEFHLSESLDGDESFRSFFSLLGEMPALRLLDVSTSRLSYHSGKYIGQVIRYFSSLQVLNLSHNDLDVEGATDFAAALEGMKCLVKLSVGSCHIGNLGTASIVGGLLRSVCPLEELDLSNNDITDAGVRDVCNTLSKLTSPQLKYLVLSDNYCTSSSQVQLEEMMRNRQSTCVVRAKGTPLEDVASETEGRCGSKCSSKSPSTDSSSL